MKIPKTPPGIMSIQGDILESGRFEKILQASQDAAHDGRYPHWDKLRRLRPPGDLTHEEWWFALKFGRSATQKELPLQDAGGRPFRFGMPAPISEQLHHIDQDASGRIETAGQEIANTGTRDRYIVHSLVEEAITSSQIEGAATTRLVAKAMLRSGRRPRDISERMILNNYAAIQRIRALKDRPLTPEMVKELQSILTEETLDNPEAVGRFRRPNEPIMVVDPYNEVLHTPPPAEQLDERIQSLCSFANGETPNFFIHPVVRAIALHFWLAYDHPFVDGNGRCARALFYWLMLRQGYWLCEFLSISQVIQTAQAQYGRAFLYTETDDNDLTYFLLYHLKVVSRAIKELHAYIARKADETRQTEKMVRSSSQFNHRQVALLSHALRHPDAAYTVQFHQASHNVVYQTARTDLAGLADEGLLTVRKTGRKLHYFPVPDLADKLNGPA